MKTKTSAVSEEVAVKELTDFYNHFALEPLTEEEVVEELKIAKLAVQQGLLVFDKDTKVPTFTLKEPVLNEKQEVSLSEVTFKTRIFPSDHVKLSKGLNIQKDTMLYANKCTSFLIGQGIGYLNKFGKFDYNVIQQLGTVFA